MIFAVLNLMACFFSQSSCTLSDVNVISMKTGWVFVGELSAWLLLTDFL